MFLFFFGQILISIIKLIGTECKLFLILNSLCYVQLDLKHIGAGTCVNNSGNNCQSLGAILLLPQESQGI